MRKIDTGNISIAFQKLQDGRKEEARKFHELELWRDHLIETGPSATEEVVTKYPKGDRQHIRQLIMQAVKEKNANKPPASARKLFRYLKEISLKI